MATDTDSTQRRELRFDNLQQVLADAQQAVAQGYTPIGNWTAGQIFAHLAIGMESSIDGFKFKVAPPLRWFMKTFLKKRLLQKGLPTGIKLTGDAERLLKPKPCTNQEGLDRLRTAVHRLETETQRMPSPLLGDLDIEQWNQFHMRHAELHLGFLVPPDTTEGSP